MVVDLDSTNGSFVDDERVKGEAAVAPGSSLRFGDVTLTFEPTDDALGVVKGGGTVVARAPVDLQSARKAAPAPHAPPRPAAAPVVARPAPKPSPSRAPKATAAPKRGPAPPPEKKKGKGCGASVVVLLVGASGAAHSPTGSSPSDARVHLTAAGRTDVGTVRSGNEDSYAIAPRARDLHRRRRHGRPCGRERWRARWRCATSRASWRSVNGSGTARSRIVCAGRFAPPTARSSSAHSPKWTSGAWARRRRLLVLHGARYLIGQVGRQPRVPASRGSLMQITKDHSYVQEQVDAGFLTPEQARYASLQQRHHALRGGEQRRGARIVRRHGEAQGPVPARVGRTHGDARGCRAGRSAAAAGARPQSRWSSSDRRSQPVAAAWTTSRPSWCGWTPSTRPAPTTRWCPGART